MKVNALLLALLLGVSSFVPVQAAKAKSGASQAIGHRVKSKSKGSKHSKPRSHSSKTKKS
jgi:hypothetical protein